MLTPSDLKGFFVSLPTPWAEDGSLDTGLLRENVARLADHGIHGFYAMREFYAMSDDEFLALSRALAAETTPRGIPAMVGIYADSEQGVMNRARLAYNAGLRGAMIALPYWEALRPDEAVDFCTRIARAHPDMGFVLHNTMRTKRLLTVDEFAPLQDLPNMTGLVHVTESVYERAEAILRLDRVAVFAHDDRFAMEWLLGARVCNSSLGAMNPSWAVRFYQALQQGDWDTASAMQRTAIRYYLDIPGTYYRKGYTTPAVETAVQIAAGFLKGNARVRLPYKSVPPHEVAQIREQIRTRFPELFWE